MSDQKHTLDSVAIYWFRRDLRLFDNYGLYQALKGEAPVLPVSIFINLTRNNGVWQWAAGKGTDAAPYFRILNPTAQLKKFDPQLKYVKRWLPEYDTSAYPEPIVDYGDH